MHSDFLGLIHFDFWGLVVLFFALLVISGMQVAAALGTMYVMHKWIPDRLTDRLYGEFDFDNYQKVAFQDVLLRLAAVFVPATLVIHLLEYFLVGRYLIRYKLLVCCVLLLLETGAITAGFNYLFRLDQFRLRALVGASALFYLFCLWYLAAGQSFLY